YPHLNLAKYLGTVNRTLSIMGQGQILTRELQFDPSNSRFIVIYHSQDMALAFVREFKHENGKRIVDHTLFTIPPSFRMRNLCKPVFNESLQQYVNSDIALIRVCAALADGGLVWGKFGFVATRKREVTTILDIAKSALGSQSADFKRVKKIY